MGKNNSGRKYLGFASLLFLALMAKSPVLHAGFDCTKAVSPVGKAICSDKDLLKIENDLNRNYTAVQKLLVPEQVTMLKRSQREWVTNRQEWCVKPNLRGCIKSMTEERNRLLTGQALAGKGEAGFIPFFLFRDDDNEYQISIAGVRFVNPQQAGEKAFNADFDKMVQDAPVDKKIGYKSAPKPYFHMSTDLKYNGKRLISALGLMSLYSGGAHPNSQFYGINVDRLNGKLNFSSLFRDGAIHPIMRACLAVVEAERKVRLSKYDAYEHLSDSMQMAMRKIVKNIDYWHFEGQRAYIHFNQYILGSYAEGVYECELPYALLRPLVNDPDLLND